MLQNTKGAKKNWKSRKTGNTGYTRWRQTKQNHIYVGHHICSLSPENRWEKSMRYILSVLTWQTHLSIDSVYNVGIYLCELISFVCFTMKW
jgi:hypothetical protein